MAVWEGLLCCCFPGQLVYAGTEYQEGQLGLDLPFALAG
jgi:hypothetical protein